jgi:hypothetical protein
MNHGARGGDAPVDRKKDTLTVISFTGALVVALTK